MDSQSFRFVKSQKTSCKLNIKNDQTNHTIYKLAKSESLLAIKIKIMSQNVNFKKFVTCLSDTL